MQGREDYILYDVNAFSKQLGQPVIFGNLVLEIVHHAVNENGVKGNILPLVTKLQGTPRAANEIREYANVVKLGIRYHYASRCTMMGLDIGDIKRYRRPLQCDAAAVRYSKNDLVEAS